MSYCFPNNSVWYPTSTSTTLTHCMPTVVHCSHVGLLLIPNMPKKILASKSSHLFFSYSWNSCAWLWTWGFLSFQSKVKYHLWGIISDFIWIIQPSPNIIASYYFTSEKLSQSKNVLLHVCLYITYLYMICLSTLKCYLHENSILTGATFLYIL